MGLTLNHSDLEHLYPFYLALNSEGKIMLFGRSATKCFKNIHIGADSSEIFAIKSPKTFHVNKDFKTLVHKVVTLNSISTGISLNGEVLHIDNDELFVFAITPLIQNVDSLTTYHLTYSDFPAYSPVFDFFILIQAERFARLEQSKAYAALEEQNAFSKLNLDIANFCSRCFEVSDAFAYIFPLLQKQLGWKCRLEEAETKEKSMSLPLMISGVQRYNILLTTEKGEVPTGGSINFITSLKYTLENVILRMDNYAATQEAQALKVVSSKMYTLGEMAASIAHELNNPLTIIQGLAWMSSSLLEGEQPPVAKLTENMNKIIAMTERSGKIIKGLRVFARDATDDPMEQIELNVIIEETLELCKGKIKSRGVTIEWEPGEQAYSKGKSVQISQVLLNLLNNAADAIEGQASPWIKISFAKKDDFWAVSVTDSGQGIAPEVVKKMMSPFFTTKPVGKGTGLGLSISSSILKSHNGDFWYDKDCQNTRFCFSLPIWKE